MQSTKSAMGRHTDPQDAGPSREESSPHGTHPYLGNDPCLSLAFGTEEVPLGVLVKWTQANLPSV